MDYPGGRWWSGSGWLCVTAVRRLEWRGIRFPLPEDGGIVVVSMGDGCPGGLSWRQVVVWEQMVVCDQGSRTTWLLERRAIRQRTDPFGAWRQQGAHPIPAQWRCWCRPNILRIQSLQTRISVVFSCHCTPSPSLPLNKRKLILSLSLSPTLISFQVGLVPFDSFTGVVHDQKKLDQIGVCDLIINDTVTKWEIPIYF